MQTTSRSLMLLIALGLILTTPLAFQRTALASGAPGQTVSDDTLKDRIEYRLDTTDAVKKYDLHVKVEDGVAMLTGTVATAAQKIEAGTLANIKGVTRVDNQIAIDKDVNRTLASHTKNGLRKTLVFTADSGTGKSETITAMMEQAISAMNRTTPRWWRGLKGEGTRAVMASLSVVVDRVAHRDDRLVGPIPPTVGEHGVVDGDRALAGGVVRRTVEERRCLTDEGGIAGIGLVAADHDCDAHRADPRQLIELFLPADRLQRQLPAYFTQRTHRDGNDLRVFRVQ